MIKKGFAWILFSLLSSLLFAGFSIDADLGIGATINDDDLFIRINARYFDRDPESVYAAARRMRMPDREVPIAFFLAYHSKRNVDAVIQMHSGGNSWWDVSLSLGIPASVYFMDIPYEPGPPYGKAYGYWKKHQRNPAVAVILSDREMNDLISLQMTCHYYGLPPHAVMKLRQEGKDFKQIMTGEYKQRHVPQGQLKMKQEETKGHGKKK